MGRKILFVTTDQQRYDALGCNGNTIARTPVIDRLAAEGIVYRRAYNQNTVCMPARSTMLTGQYVRTHGVVANGIPLPTDAPSVAAHLSEHAGYRTALLTNISRSGESVWRSLLPVDELFDVVVDSSQVRLRKPDPAIFLLTCERLGLEPRECLFVDDLHCNVDAATELGMTTIQCDDPVVIADEVVELLLGRAAAAEPESAGAGR